MVVAVGADEVDVACQAGDRRVVGVVSGGGEFSTALRLGAGRGGQRVAVALVGRVHCHADAGSAPIALGDLLVTGPVAGHAMRAPADPAPGTVFAKALGSLDNGTGLVPVLLMAR